MDNFTALCMKTSKIQPTPYRIATRSCVDPINEATGPLDRLGLSRIRHGQSYTVKLCRLTPQVKQCPRNSTDHPL